MSFADLDEKVVRAAIRARLVRDGGKSKAIPASKLVTLLRAGVRSPNPELTGSEWIIEPLPIPLDREEQEGDTSRGFDSQKWLEGVIEKSDRRRDAETGEMVGPSDIVQRPKIGVCLLDDHPKGGSRKAEALLPQHLRDLLRNMTTEQKEALFKKVG